MEAKDLEEIKKMREHVELTIIRLRSISPPKRCTDYLDEAGGKCLDIIDNCIEYDRATDKQVKAIINISNGLDNWHMKFFGKAYNPKMSVCKIPVIEKKEQEEFRCLLENL